MEFGDVRSQLGLWINQEPAAALWLGLVAVLIFGVTYIRWDGDSEYTSVWGWRLARSLSSAFGFIALLAMFYFLLNSSYTAFNNNYASFTTQGSISNRTWQQFKNHYGAEFWQQDLRVTQYETIETREVIQSDDPAIEPRYQYTQVERPVLQNSIMSFRGNVIVNLADASHQTDTFNAFQLDASYEYEIINPTDKETRVEFRFPISAYTKLYDDLQIRVNDEEISYYQVISDTIAWDGSLAPDEKNLVSIHYLSTGMDWYIFHFTEPREVMDFSLTVSSNTYNRNLHTSPSNGTIQMMEKFNPPYKVVTWTIEHAIVAPTLGLNFRQYWPYAPYSQMIETMPYGGRALILCFSLVVLTLLILGAPFRLEHLALITGLFTVPYFILMAGGIPLPVTADQYSAFQVKILPALTIAPLILAFIILRKKARLSFTQIIIVLTLMALFMAVYPRIGILADEQKRNAVEGIVQVLMIAYVFVLALFVRMRKPILMGEQSQWTPS